MASDEPIGLYLSLDDIIKRNQEQTHKGERQRGGGHQGPRRQQGYGGGGGGGGSGGGQYQQREQRQYNDGGYGRQPRRGGYGGGGGGGGGRGGGFQQQQSQQQQQQQQQPLQQQPQRGAYQQQQGPGGGPQQQQYHHQHQLRGPKSYRSLQSCFEDAATGDVVFKFRRSELVRITPSGAVTLTSDGFYNPSTLASLNDALNLIGIRVTAPSGNPVDGDWSISDGRSLMRFHDGVVLPAKGPQHAARGRQMLLAFQSPNRAAAAAATAASNAAATAAGILPHTGFVPPGRPGVVQPVVVQPSGESVFARLGAGAGPRDDDRTRRLKAQGRYQPY